MCITAITRGARGRPSIIPLALSLTPFSHSTGCLSAFVLFEKAETTETKCADFVPPNEREKLREREWESECARAAEICRELCPPIGM